MTTPTTTQPTQAGREKCHADCGKRVIDLPGNSYFKFTHPDFCYADGVKYCTQDCRVARLPPIAPSTPAPAREVKVGQRYQSSRTGNICKVEWINLATGRLGLCWETGAGSVNWPLEEFVDRKWTLLDHAPATSEPGLPFVAKCCGAVGLESHRPHCAFVKPAPPAQEAAKAEPKCVGVKSFPCFGPRALRHTVKGKPPFYLCDGHYLHAEASLVPDYDTRKTSIDSMPERLPRPRLTHSAMWADWAEDTQ